MNTETIPAADRAGELLAQIDHALAQIGDQQLLSQGRCVDQLLDLFTSTEDPVVRAAIGAVLDEIRLVTAVRARDMRSDLLLLAAIVDVETAFAA